MERERQVVQRIVEQRIEIDGPPQVVDGGRQIAHGQFVGAQVLVRRRRRRIELEYPTQRGAGLIVPAGAHVRDAERVVRLGIVRVRADDGFEQRDRLGGVVGFLEIPREHDHHALVRDAAAQNVFERRDRAAQIPILALHRRQDPVGRRETRMRARDRADGVHRRRPRSRVERDDGALQIVGGSDERLRIVGIRERAVAWLGARRDIAERLQPLPRFAAQRRLLSG